MCIYTVDGELNAVWKKEEEKKTGICRLVVSFRSDENEDEGDE
jgi:hypothetical protein